MTIIILRLILFFVLMTIGLILVFRKAYYYEIKFFKGINFIYTTILILIYSVISFYIFKYILSNS